MKFTIKGRLPNLNDITNSSRGNYHKANKQKQHAQEYISLFLPKCKVKQYPVWVYVVYFERDKRRDVDNIAAGGNKVLMDAMKNHGLITDDSPKYIEQVISIVQYDKCNPRIEVIISDQTYMNNFIKAYCKLK
jgi:Holliday junction resolvase RusA-like endonuclease